MCETAMKDSRLTQPSLRECVIWAWQRHNGNFLVIYQVVSLKELCGYGKGDETNSNVRYA